MTSIKATELLEVLRRIESRNAIETAHRALQACGQVFRYAQASSVAEQDITQSLKGALTAVNSSNFASMTDPQQVSPLLAIRSIFFVEAKVLINKHIICCRHHATGHFVASDNLF